MKTDTLKLNPLSPQTMTWSPAYLEALDAKAVEAYGAFLADDCVMQSNNEPPVQGKAAVLRYLSPYWPAFDSLEHGSLDIYGDDSSFVLEALNHSTRQEGRKVTPRAVACTDRDDTGRAVSIRFYTNTAPLFAPDGS